MMRISTVVKYLTFISTLMLLNACGGGGSSAVPSPTVSMLRVEVLLNLTTP